MAGLISENTIGQIRQASDIVDVVGGYIPLKKAGTSFRALCPFHREKSPSFNVVPAKQIFHCFGCGKGGDVFRFVQDYEGLTFIEAVRRLAERARIPLEMDNDPARQQTRALKDTLLLIHEQICQRWQAALNQEGGQIARDYLAKRAVSAEAVQLFRIGYAPEAWDDTVNWARSKGFDPALVEQAGLIIRKEGTERHYDRFRGRLMFPICDEQDRVIGFSGRILQGDDKTAKYVNSPETPIFSKGRVIFGLNKSKRALLDTKTAVVCEGQLDLIACFMGGVTNVVAPQGTAFTPEHARILKRYAEEVVLCFDADNAGQNAAVRALDALLGAGLTVRVASVPNGKDPDEFIKQNGGEAFADVIKRAPGFFDWYLDRLTATNDANSDKGRVTISRSMAEALAKAGNDVVVDKYVQKTALKLGVSSDAVRADFKKQMRAGPAPMEEEYDMPPPMDEAAYPRPSPGEIILLQLLLENEDVIAQVAGVLAPEWLTHELVRRAVEQSLEAHQNGSWPGLASWVGALEDIATQRMITEALATPHHVTDAAGVLFGTPTKSGLLPLLRDKWVDAQIAAVNQRLADPDLPEEDANHLLARKQELRHLKGKPLLP